MADKRLLEKVNRLGLPMMDVQDTFDANQTLADVVKSHDTRLWEGFPVLLANAAKLGDLDVKRVEAYLTREEDRRAWRNLLVMSLTFYRAMNKVFWFAEPLRKTFSSKEEKWFRDSWLRMRNAESFKLENKEFSVPRLKAFLDNYLEEAAFKAQKTQAKYDELSLEYALSQVFSPKQKELFWKKVKGEVLTKTEREYYSRTVKRKVQALANDELPALARKVLG